MNLRLATARSRTERIIDRYDWAIALGVFLIGALLIFTRRPDALLNAQFYIEDGVLWYAQAHEQGGFRALLSPSYRGYLHTVPRLGGLAAQPVPLAWAPFVMNLIAILSGALPAAIIASKRFANVLPRPEARLLAAFLYLGLPGAWTTMANMTHTQWHFALLAALVVVAAPATTTAWKVFDVVVCVLSGLTGPTSIFLAPVAALAWGTRRTRWSLVVAAVVAATAAAQATSILVSAGETEGDAFLGASPMSFLNLFARRVVLEAFVGDAGLSWLMANAAGFLENPAVIVFLAIAGAAIFAVIAWKGTPELRLLFLFAAFVYLASLAWPPASTHSDHGYWEILTAPGNGNRYFLIPVFALITGLVWVAFTQNRPARIVGGVALVAMLALGVALDWREPPLRDYNFEQYAAKYEQASPGQRVQVVTPPGWSFVLTKR
jgi:hypothetical protein